MKITLLPGGLSPERLTEMLELAWEEEQEIAELRERVEELNTKIRTRQMAQNMIFVFEGRAQVQLDESEFEDYKFLRDKVQYTVLVKRTCATCGSDIILDIPRATYIWVQRAGSQAGFTHVTNEGYGSTCHLAYEGEGFKQGMMCDGCHAKLMEQRRGR